MDKLKPCPFCGGSANFEDGCYGGFNIECTGCEARGPQPIGSFLYDTEEEAIEEWNRRAQSTWIRCEDRLPTEADADCDGKVWLLTRGIIIRCHWLLVANHEDGSGDQWQPTNLERPRPPEV